MKEHFFNIDTVPKDWNGLNRRQLRKACLILHNKKTRLEKVQALTPVLADARDCELYAVLDEMIEATDFLFQQSSRTEPPFTDIRVGREKLYGPKAKLLNITFGEFVNADGIFTRYLQTTKDEDLNLLCACLYRKRKSKSEIRREDYDGDTRRRFNANTMKPEAKKWHSVQLGDRLAVLAFFAGCKAYIAKAYPNLFKKNTDKDGKGSSWYRALHQYTDSVLEYEGVLDNKLYTVLFSMSETVADAESLKGG